MTWCNVTMHRAIGTAAAIGFPVALFGTIGYIVNGWHIPGLARIQPGLCLFTRMYRYRYPQHAGRPLWRTSVA